MKKTFKLKAALLLVAAFMFSGMAAFAQMDSKKPLASPRDSVSGMAGSATLTINYGSPSVKGRKIWGGLEKYGVVWRAGANEATTFTTDKDIMVEGHALPAGKYGFFLIPSKGKWTVIFNSVPNQWGAFKYDSTKDVLRVMVKARKAAMPHERLVYVIDPKGFAMDWDQVNIWVKVK
jgi:hypothetical protein